MVIKEITNTPYIEKMFGPISTMRIEEPVGNRIPHAQETIRLEWLAIEREEIHQKMDFLSQEFMTPALRTAMENSLDWSRRYSRGLIATIKLIRYYQDIGASTERIEELFHTPPTRSRK